MTLATGLVLPLYYISIGLLLFAALQSLVVGLSGHRTPLHAAFTALCLFASGFQLASVAAYEAHDLAAAVVALRWQGAMALLAYLALVPFTALFTGRRVARGPLLAVCGGFLVLTAWHLTLPYGFRWTRVWQGEPIRMPWGESLLGVHGTPGLPNLFVRLVSGAVTVWAAVCAVRMYREGRRRGAALFIGFLVLQFCATAWGALIDLGLVDGIYLPGFAFLALALLMTAGMGMDLRDRTRELARAASSLTDQIDLRRSAETHIRRLAYEDPLTGLANRAQLLDYLEAMLVEVGGPGEPGGAMILVDLDHFKTINVALSHAVGDEVLREVSARIRRTVPEGAFVCRLGGDEFAVVLGGLPDSHDESEAAARGVAEALLTRLVGPLQIGARVLDVGASAGIVRFPADANSSGDILRRADMALSHAKALGRNNVQFYLPALQAAADARLELERGLRTALADGNLHLRYQPQVSASGAVSGAEVLLRWRHPELGEIGPDRFIPVAEETGLIHELGDWVLETACERMAEWAREEAPFSGHLSVNVSGWQLVRPGFVERVERTLERFHLPPERLTLEVTESTFLYHLDEAAAQLHALREYGVRIALDDFGTGYSSLSYLQNLPLDELKIDRSFVRQVHPGVESPLVESIVAIARNLRLDVVAEGVELDSQRRALAALGCDMYQGYLFAPPLPQDEFIAWLSARPAPVDA